MHLFTVDPALVGADFRDDSSAESREARLAESTGGHPELTRYLTKLVNDPYVPPSTKRVIHDALMMHEVKVRELTEEVRWDLNLPGTIGTHAFNSYTENAKFEEGTSDKFFYFGPRRIPPVHDRKFSFISAPF